MRARYLLISMSVLFCLLASGALVPAAAAESSPWDNDTRSAVRLLAARPRVIEGAQKLRAGVEVKLEPGWKTYGRFRASDQKPGSSRWDLPDNDVGVPPLFDFSSSENIKTVSVLWPEPVRFDEGSGSGFYSFGYLGSVIFPLHILPRDPSKPATLRLNLDYAVCQSVCMPAKAKVELVLSNSTGVFDGAVSAAEARVKKPSP